MESVSDQLLGMELNEAESLLQVEGVTFVVKYTETNRKKTMFEGGEKKHRIVRVKDMVNEDKGVQKELTVCIV